MALNPTQVRLCCRLLRLLLGYTMLVAIAKSAPVSIRDDRGSAHEFQVKAAFLFNFAQFVEWPPSAFERPDSPLVIGILGADPFGSFLDEIVRDEKVGNRPLVVERYQSLADVRDCHVLFVSGSEGRHVERIAAALKGHPTLTVCDWEGLSKYGVMIRFVMERSHVKLRIDLEAARSAGLTISSKLLRSAEIVSMTSN